MKKPIHPSDDSLLVFIFVITMAVIAWVVWTAHKDAPRLQEECEAQGGMLISTRNELYTCVGKPTKPADPA